MNEGEGGCRVGDTFYAAFSDIRGTDSGNRTAEHHALQQLISGSNSQKWVRPNEEACGETAAVPPVP
ncbi:MAG: hypothetical protein ACYSYV_08520 [Planctomycetota bacterium]